MKFDNLKEQMIEQDIIRRGLNDKNIINAFKRVPREKFVPTDTRIFTYDDRPLSIGEGQTISQPFIVAYMIEKLNLEGENVLEIGTGSGYQTALLSEIFEKVYTIERNENLYNNSKKILNELGYKNITFKCGDGKEGYSDLKFDNIIVSAAAKNIPEKLVEQLKINGIMVIPFGELFYQNLYKIIKLGKNNIKQEKLIGVRFVPLID